MVGIYIVLGVLVVLALLVVSLYNKLVSLRNRVKNAWSQVDVQLKRRHDLIPNLVETAKGYLTHEREVLENVTRARQQAVDARGIEGTAQAENFLSQTLRSLFAVVEAYPDLKANQNMLALQEELTSTENKIAFSRQFYNDCVMEFNNATEQFPSSMVAGSFGFQPAPMFEIEDPAQREVPRVSFS